MNTVTILIIVAILLAALWRSGVGEWLRWNASYLLDRNAAERRALWRLELKLGLLKTLARAIARVERRRNGSEAAGRHTRS
jgi:hypothetical protein